MLSTFELGDLNLIQSNIIKNYLLYPLVKPAYIGHDKDFLSSKIISLLKEHCEIPLIAWTIKDKDQYQSISEFCENIIFEGFRP